MQTIQEFHRSLIPEILGEMFKCGAEDLLPSETHTERLRVFMEILSIIRDPSRGWHIHAVLYACIDQHIEWLFYASKSEFPNPYLQDSVIQWIQHRREQNFFIEELE